MNCLYITLFFNIVAGIVQTFIKSWNQLLYPRVTEVCHLPFEPRMTFSCTSSSSSNFFPGRCFFRWRNKWKSLGAINSNSLFANFRWKFTFCVEKSYDGTHLTFGGTLDRHCHFKHISLKQSRFYHSNKHGSQVKDQGRRQCCHNKHKKFPNQPTHDVSLLSGHTMYVIAACFSSL